MYEFNNLATGSVVKTTLPPAVYTAANTNGTSVDVRAGEKNDFVIVLGTWTDGTQTYSFQSAPDNAGAPGTWADVPAAELDDRDSVLTAGKLVVSSNANAGKVYAIPYIGAGAWLRINVADVGGTTGGAAAALVASTQRRFVGANNPGSRVLPTT